MDVETRLTSSAAGTSPAAAAAGTRGERPGRARKTAVQRPPRRAAAPPSSSAPTSAGSLASCPGASNTVPKQQSFPGSASCVRGPPVGPGRRAGRAEGRGARARPPAASRSRGRVQHLDSGSGRPAARRVEFAGAPRRAGGAGGATGSWKSRTQPGGHPWLRTGHVSLEPKYLSGAHMGPPPRSACQSSVDTLHLTDTSAAQRVDPPPQSRHLSMLPKAARVPALRAAGEASNPPPAARSHLPGITRGRKGSQRRDSPGKAGGTRAGEGSAWEPG